MAGLYKEREQTDAPQGYRGCIRCGAQLQADAKFCKYCGQFQTISSESTDRSVKRSGKGKHAAGILLSVLLIAVSVSVLLFCKDRMAEKSDVRNINEASSYKQADRETPQNDLKTFPEREKQEESGPDEINLPEAAGGEPDEISLQEPDELEQKAAKQIMAEMEVFASSELSGGNYAAENLIDGDFSTAWSEGIDGYGIGEAIVYRCPGDSVWLYGFAVASGYQKSKELFEKNGMPTKFLIETGDFTETVTWEEDLEENEYRCCTYEFAVPVLADEITVTILDVREGTAYEDTCISEMYFYTYAEEE